MPVPELMKWEGSPAFRWVKMYKGIRLKVTCKELGTPRTKNESQAAANDWYQKRKADIDGQSVLSSTNQAAIKHREDLISVGNPERANERQKEIDLIKAGKLNLDDASNVEINPKKELSEVGQAVIQDRLNRSPAKAPKNKTVGHHLDQFLKLVGSQQKVMTRHELAQYLESMTESGKVWTRDTPCDQISEETVNQHYFHLISKGYVPGTHNKCLGFFRRLVNYMAQNRLCLIPLNLNSNIHRKKPKHKAVKKFENENVKEVIKLLKPRQRLWALLGLNCGMTNADLGALTWDMIDTTNWTLTRRRVKTGDLESTPTVTYKLFPEVVELLKELTTTGFVFQTANGLQMYTLLWDEETNKRIKKDMFSTSWNRLSPKPTITLDRFRSIATTVLRSNPTFARYEEYFLAHSPKTVTDKHYGVESDDAFFKALDFIHDEVMK